MNDREELNMLLYKAFLEGYDAYNDQRLYGDHLENPYRYDMDNYKMWLSWKNGWSKAEDDHISPK